LPDVRLNAVKSVRVAPDEVAVTYQQGDSLTVSSAFAFSRSRCAAIEFNPPLPAAHRKWSMKSHMRGTKVMIQYRKRFWNDLGWNGRMGSDLPIVYTWHATSHIEGEDGIMTAYTGGEPGANFRRYQMKNGSCCGCRDRNCFRVRRVDRTYGNRARNDLHAPVYGAGIGRGVETLADVVSTVMLFQANMLPPFRIYGRRGRDALSGGYIISS
jgi:hypothetical protein